MFEKLNAIGNESVDATTFNEDELKMIAVARALAGAVKAVIDTPILTTEGSISSESLNVCNNVGKLLPDFSKIIKSENSGITSEGIEITAGKIKIPTQSAEESANRVMGWIAAHHGFDKIAVYEVLCSVMRHLPSCMRTMIALCTQQTDFLINYPIRLAKRSPLSVV